MKPTAPEKRPPGVDERNGTLEKTRSGATAPDGLRDADASVVGVYLADEQALECRRCHLEAAAGDGATPGGETISESELTPGDGWLCRTCRTDLRTCARIDRLEAALEIAASTITGQRDELSRMREHLRSV